MFGKLMSISDEMMWRYYLLLTDLTPAAIESLKTSVELGSEHPLEVKKALARHIITDFHGSEAALRAQQDFEAQFSSKGVDPDLEVRKVEVPSQRGEAFEVAGARIGLRADEWLVALKLAKSKSDAQRQIKAGAVSVAAGNLANPAWKKVTDPAAEFAPWKYRTEQETADVVFKVGRKQSRIQLKFSKS